MKRNTTNIQIEELDDDFFDFREIDTSVEDPDAYEESIDEEGQYNAHQHHDKSLGKDFIEALPYLIAFAIFMAVVTWWGITNVHHL